jgi:hypothetical protein
MSDMFAIRKTAFPTTAYIWIGLIKPIPWLVIIALTEMPAFN